MRSWLSAYSSLPDASCFHAERRTWKDSFRVSSLLTSIRLERAPLPRSTRVGATPKLPAKAAAPIQPRSHGSPRTMRAIVDRMHRILSRRQREHDGIGVRPAERVLVAGGRDGAGDGDRRG